VAQAVFPRSVDNPAAIQFAGAHVPKLAHAAFMNQPT
jgi:hypothetical protein